MNMDFDLEVELKMMDNLKISEGDSSTSTITFVLGSSPNEEKLVVDDKSIVGKLSWFLKMNPKDNPFVSLPQNVEPNVFKIFVQLLSIENLTAEMKSHALSLESSLNLLDISKIFQTVSIQNACREFFKAELKTFGLSSILIYEHLKNSDEILVQKFAFSKIQRNLYLLDLNDQMLVKVSKQTWMKLLQVDMQKREHRPFPMRKYSELLLLKMVFKWGFLQCQINGSSLTGANIRKFIRDLLFLILFHRLSPEEMLQFEDPLNVIDAQFRQDYFQYCEAINKFISEDNLNKNDNNEKQEENSMDCA